MQCKDIKDNIKDKIKFTFPNPHLPNLADVIYFKLKNKKKLINFY